MKNIHLIPTDKPSRLLMSKRNNLQFLKDNSSLNPNNHFEGTYKNIYITSDKSPNINGYYLLNDNVVCKKDETYFATSWKEREIILTTNIELIADGVQAIDDEFLEWFVKNPSCEEVEVEKILLGKVEGTTMLISKYKIILQKEEIVGYKLKSHIDRKMVDRILKDSMPIWNDEDKSVYFIRGHVAGSLVARMKELQVLDLWFTPIYEFEEVKSDWIKQNHLDYYYKEGIMSNKPKQETLEEAAERLQKDKYGIFISKDADVKGQLVIDTANAAFLSGMTEGSNWQTERMFSKEEVIAIVEKSRATGLTAEYLIEQFKKK